MTHPGSEIKLILLDFDGTLADTRRANTLAYVATLRETLIFEDSEIGLEAARRSGASYFRVKL